MQSMKEIKHNFKIHISNNNVLPPWNSPLLIQWHLQQTSQRLLEYNYLRKAYKINIGGVSVALKKNEHKH
jgi:hypothetical protein